MIYTMGHSTWVPDQFVAAIRTAIGRSATVVDVRSHPVSRWEWFDNDELVQWLPAYDLGYMWARALGGWTSRHVMQADYLLQRGVDVRAYASGKFPKHHIAKGSQSTLFPQWTNQGLYDYSWYTAQPDFLQTLGYIIKMARHKDLVLMCAEAQWWRCHRSMISDVLLYAGVDSYHVMPRFHTDGTCIAKLDTHSKIVGNRLDRYDAEIKEKWASYLVLPVLDTNRGAVV